MSERVEILTSNHLHESEKVLVPPFKGASAGVGNLNAVPNRVKFILQGRLIVSLLNELHHGVEVLHLAGLEALGVVDDKAVIYRRDDFCLNVALSWHQVRSLEAINTKCTFDQGSFADPGLAQQQDTEFGAYAQKFLGCRCAGHGLRALTLVVL